ncbi:MAG: hypothetical protein EON60_03085 [Alphaproteobacteria bacterium]|nr:MAG: hypothetical protein EON60_03085 [Alphaproteobacteria bacterium]
MKSLLVSTFATLLATQAFAIDVTTSTPKSSFNLDAFLQEKLWDALPDEVPQLAYIESGICLNHKIDTDDGALLCNRKVNFVLPQVVGATSSAQVEKLATSFTDFNPAFVETALLELPKLEEVTCKYEARLPNGNTFCADIGR